MANDQPVEFFVERVANMSHANGVFRLTFAQQAEGDGLSPTVRLLIPANQLSPILQGISNAARDIGEQVQARLNDGDDDVAESKATAPKSKAKAPKK